jgi:hypothetical protein
MTEQQLKDLKKSLETQIQAQGRIVNDRLLQKLNQVKKALGE